MRWLRWPATWSLQNSLLAIAFFVSLVAWIAGGSVIWRVAQEHAESLHDVALRHTAALLLGLSGHEIDELGASTPLEARIANSKADSASTLGEDYRYQLWSQDGQLLLSNFGLPSAAAMARMNRPGYSWLNMDGERWRVYSLVSAELKQELHIAEREAARGWFGNAIDWKIAVLIPVSLLAVMFPAMLLVRRVMRPLRQVHEQLEARSAANLTHLQIQGAPSELQPIVAAMNALFRRMNEAMERESSFTSMAAHELRTPLASLRLLAQTVQGTSDPAVRAQAIKDLIASVDRCSHLQDQLLTLARLDASKDADLATEVNLTETVTEVIAEIAPLAKSRGIRISSHTDAAVLNCHPFGVRTLLRNLLSNAVNYTPVGGRIELVVSSEGDDLTLTVDDSGCGIPASERDRMFERFERMQRDQQSGVGLGLSIVRSVVQAHGSTIKLEDSPLGGLRVVVGFRGRRVDVGEVDGEDRGRGLAFRRQGPARSSRRARTGKARVIISPDCRYKAFRSRWMAGLPRPVPLRSSSSDAGRRRQCRNCITPGSA